MKLTKIKKNNYVPEPKEPVEVTEETIKYKLTAKDQDALYAYKSYLKQKSYLEKNIGAFNLMSKVKMHALEQRYSLDELMITEQTHDGMFMEIVVPIELYDELEAEAKSLGLKVGDFVRAIWYTFGFHAKKAKRSKFDADMKYKKDNRFIDARFTINKELRNILFGIYGEVTDKQLQSKLAQDLPQLLKEKSVQKKLTEQQDKRIVG